MLELAQANLLSPPVLCFVLGAIAWRIRADLGLPEAIYSVLSAYLMLSIGLRGGAELAHEPLAQLALPLLAALTLGCAIPAWTFAVLRRFGGLDTANAAAMAAHYGSVSAVTFAAVTAMLDRQGVAFEGYAATLLAVMEVPAIVIGIGLARAAGVGGGPLGSLGGILASKSVLLLIGGLVIGALSGPERMRPVEPFFVELFPGALCAFLLEMGRVTAQRLGEFVKVGPRLVIFALVAPVLHAMAGLVAAWAVGLSAGGAVVLATLSASASYIAAPAAVGQALPEANPGYYLTCALGLTFPFNIIVGLPLYQAMAGWLYG